MTSGNEKEIKMLLYRMKTIKVTSISICSIISIILSILIGFSDAEAISFDEIKKFIYDQYLKEDKELKDTSTPINRFRNIGTPHCTQFLLPIENKKIFLERASFEDGLFDIYITVPPKDQKIILKKIIPEGGRRQNDRFNLNEIFSQVPISSKLKKHLFPTRICETKFGSFIFYRLNHLSRLSKSINTEILDNEKRCFVDGFVVKQNYALLIPNFYIQKVDQENEKYSRELWDIFPFRERVFVLIFLRLYENHIFEIYSLDQNKIKLQFSFSFGGL